MKKSGFLRPLLWSCIVFAFFGCKKDSFISGDDPDFAIMISYEEETRSSLSNLSSASAVKSDAGVLAEEIQCMRQKIRIGIKNDGSSIMEMTRMKPKHAVTIPEKVNPGRTNEVHMMRFENGQVTLYNAKRQQIGQEHAEIPSYKSLVTQVRQNKNNLTRSMYSGFLSKHWIKSAGNENVNVTDDGNYTIICEVIVPDDGMDPSMNGYTICNYLETATGIPVGATIVDEKGTTIFRTVMAYDEDENNPLPVFSHEESFGTTETGDLIMITTLRYIEDVEKIIE